MVDCFQGYGDFIKNFYGNLREDMYPDPEQSAIHQWNGKINLIHLNSAIICNEDNTRKQVIDIHRLSNPPESVSRNLPSILLAHHPFDSLHKHHQNTLVRFISDWPIFGNSSDLFQPKKAGPEWLEMRRINCFF